MYQINQVMKLDGKKFYDVSVWNMFGRRKAMGIVLNVILGMGLWSVGSALPYLKLGNTNSFILNAGLGIVVLIMGIYMLTNNLSHFRRSSRNPEFLAKTEKHIKMDEEKILNYRASVGEEVNYEWKQVTGIYDRKDDLIFCMKDQQILVLDKASLTEEGKSLIKAKADVASLWKKSFPMQIWIVIAAVIAAAGIAFAVFGWMTA